MKKRIKGFGVYAALILAIVLIWYFFEVKSSQDAAYTQEQFVEAMDDNDVVAVEVSQSRDVPTGTLIISLKAEDENGKDTIEVKELNVSDVNEAQNLMKKHGFKAYTLDEVPAESFLKDLLPLLLVFAAIFILFIILLNNQAANSGGGNSKMMNFGKSRAKMAVEDENKVTFKGVAGLQEEKEELSEIVDFLKAPKIGRASCRERV